MKADYYCEICGKEKKDQPIDKPPKCCGQSMTRKWDVPNIVYRGSGWTGAQTIKREDE